MDNVYLHGQRSAVHPHVRGVYGLLKGGLVIPIPTHVGFTIPNGHAGCGKTGPSPHAWGLRGIQARRHPPLRFIPTCVGFTLVPAAEPLMVPVHPHIRGVYGRVCADLQEFPRSIPTYVGFTVEVEPAARTSTGPSPHTWGLRLRSAHHAKAVRSIPTYVGFTLHPRL